MTSFKAILVVCNFFDPTDCVEFHDSRGPYQEEEVCVARIYQMKDDILEMWPNLQAHLGYKCKEVEGT